MHNAVTPYLYTKYYRKNLHYEYIMNQMFEEMLERSKGLSEVRVKIKRKMSLYAELRY